MPLPSVRLIALTRPVAVEGLETPELLAAWCARVSNPARVGFTTANWAAVPKPGLNIVRLLSPAAICG